MRLLKFIIFGILLLWIFEAELTPQFHVNSKVELNIDIENGHPDPPIRIVLIGNDNDNRKVYFLNIDLNRNKKYTIYNVKPGNYLISFNSFRGGIFTQIQIVTFYNTQQQTFRRESFIRNRIEVHSNRNLKLDLSFKTDNDFSGFNNEMERRYKDFDYAKIIYYSSLSSYTQAIQTYYKKNNRFLASNEMVELKGPFFKNNNGGENNNNTPFCGNVNICGENTGECKVDLNVECIKDNGNIEINIKSVYFKNEWKGEVNTNTRVGKTVIGTKNERGEWALGVTSINFSAPLDEANLQNPEWPITEVKYWCDTNIQKCKFIFDYYIGVTMKTAVWKRTEMCSKLGAYQDKPVNEDNEKCRCYCDCLLEATIAHEGKHCELWIKASEELKNFCNYVKDYTTQQCCEKDDECKDQAKKLKWAIFSDLVDAVKDVYDYEAGEKQEPICDSVEYKTFRKCIRKNQCSKK